MKVQNRKNLWFRSATSSWKLPSWQVFKVTWKEPIRGTVTTFWGYKDKGKGLLNFLDDILWRLGYLCGCPNWFKYRKIRRLYLGEVHQNQLSKGQLISKPIYDLLPSPKKRADEFDLFVFLLFTANKSNSFVRFFGESTARQSAFWN